MRKLLLKAITLLLAISVLTLLVLHGCSKPPAPQNAQNAAAGPATNATTAAPAASSAEEENPAYLGATKAAMPMPPQKKK